MYLNRKGIQFSRRDSFDKSSLSPLVVSWLKNFKKHYLASEVKAVPVAIMNEIYSDGSCFDDDQLDVGIEQFMSEIDEMIWAFEADEYPDDCWLEEPTDDKPFDGKLNFPLIDAHRKRIEDGFALFAKRYDNLWW